MADAPVNPFMVLTTALAYVIAADGVIRSEEKAKLLTLMGKHVTTGAITKEELRNLTVDAFQRVSATNVGLFLEHYGPKLTYAQKLAILANMYEVMLVDGEAVDLEAWILKHFLDNFSITKVQLRVLKEVVTLASDTNIFLDPWHPCNRPDYRFNAAPRKKRVSMV